MDVTPQAFTGLGSGVVRPTRALYLFDVPKALSDAVGVSQVGMVELTAEEELMATKRAQGDAFRLAYELAKESLRSIDGRAVGAADGTADVAWSKMGAKLRQLVMSAYNLLHSPKQEEQAGFLASRQVQVG